MKFIGSFIAWSGLSSLILLSGCITLYIPGNVESTSYRIDQKMYDTDLQAAEIIAPFKEKLEATMNKIIGRASMNLSKSKPESTLGNFVADAILSEARKIVDVDIDFATQNYGGIRIGEIPEGEISVGKVFELMPFENYCVVLEIDGSSLIGFFNRIADYGGWPLSKGVTFITGKDQPSKMIIKGQEIDPNRIYHVAMPDYIANGGDNCTFFEDKKQISTGILIRDMIISHITELQSNGLAVSSSLEGRIQFSK